MNNTYIQHKYTTQTNAYVFKKIHQNNCKRRHIYILDFKRSSCYVH